MNMTAVSKSAELSLVPRADRRACVKLIDQECEIESHTFRTGASGTVLHPFKSPDQLSPNLPDSRGASSHGPLLLGSEGHDNTSLKTIRKPNKLQTMRISRGSHVNQPGAFKGHICRGRSLISSLMAVV